MKHVKSILEELYGGTIYPDELIISRDPEYRPLNKKNIRHNGHVEK